MRIGFNGRVLSSAEQTLVLSVFGPTLPAWKGILLDDGLGLHDAPWTDNPTGNVYTIAIGPVCYPNCTSTKVWTGWGRIDTVFIHEMTHVWQYFHGSLCEAEFGMGPNSGRRLHCHGWQGME
jgi:hypothetical protein